MGKVINGVGFISTKEVEVCRDCFRGNKELKSVSIPLTIESIGFRQTKYIIPKTSTFVRCFVFALSLSQLEQSIVLPSQVSGGE